MLFLYKNSSEVFKNVFGNNIWRIEDYLIKLQLIQNKLLMSKIFSKKFCSINKNHFFYLNFILFLSMTNLRYLIFQSQINILPYYLVFIKNISSIPF